MSILSTGGIIPIEGDLVGSYWLNFSESNLGEFLSPMFSAGWLASKTHFELWVVEEFGWFETFVVCFIFYFRFCGCDFSGIPTLYSIILGGDMAVRLVA